MNIDSDQNDLAFPDQATASANNTATSTAMTLKLPQHQVDRPALSTCYTPTQQRLPTLHGHPAVPVFSARASSFGALAFRPHPVAAPASSFTFSCAGATAPTSMTLAFRLHPVAKSASTSRFSRGVATQSSQFLSLPDELKVRTLSFLPAQEVASTCRAVCQGLREFIDGNQDRIARVIFKRNQTRLQVASEKISNSPFCMPNARDETFYGFMNSFLIWIERRGVVLSRPKSTLKMFRDWVCRSNAYQNTKHQRVVNGHSAQYNAFIRFLIELQNSFDQDLRNGKCKSLKRLEHFYTRGALHMKLHHDQYKDLCKQIYDETSGESCFPGRIHKSAKAELAAFPKLRLTDARSPRTDGTLHSVCRSGDVAKLQLPQLSDTIFFYYVEEEWCCEALTTQLPLVPLKRAAILERVKIF